MNEVEKMYKLANVQPQYKKRIKCKEGHLIGQPCGKCPCVDCDKSVFENVMPPFAAEKQILLIQWLLDRTDLYLHRHKTDFTYSIASGSYAVNKYKDFKESIAEFINANWQDLTEEERKQIKEILE